MLEVATASEGFTKGTYYLAARQKYLSLSKVLITCWPVLWSSSGSNMRSHSSAECEVPLGEILSGVEGESQSVQ